MANDIATWTAVVLALLCIVIALRNVAGMGKGLPLPPGPRRLPLIGNLLDMPTELEYLRFQSWSNTYGPVIYLAAAGTKLLVLNTLGTARDLLEKRSAKYSNRPHMTMLMDVIGWDWSIALMNPGKQFSQYRRVLHKGLSADVEHTRNIQEQETAKLLLRLEKRPAEFMEQIEFWAKSITLKLSYGYTPSSNEDSYIWLADQCVSSITQTGRPGAYLVDSLPFLRWVPSWMPGAGFKREAAVWGALVNEVLESPMKYATDNMHDELVQKSYVGALLQLNAHNELGESDQTQAIKETAAIVHTAGSDSVFSLLQAFVLAMTLFPHIQAQAVEEIVATIGKSRLPKFSDREHLPYVEKVFLETMRWSRPIPLGIPHQTACDDVYRGMFIPSGTVVMVNMWSISRDPELWDRPDEFLPERFEDPNAIDPRSFIFGFGRRVCAGKAVAEASVWMGIVSILSRLEISRAVDEKGREIIPQIEYTPGLICHPKPFPCSIKPRKL